MNIKLEIIFFVLVAMSGIIIFSWMIITEKRLKRFFLGKKANALEDTIVALGNDLAELKVAKEKIEKAVREIEAKQRKSIRGLETIRFNPFPDQGGNQSFAIGMLNADGDGVVLSSLYSRERMSVFAKPIKNNASEYELTAEEKEVLKKAKV